MNIYLFPRGISPTDLQEQLTRLHAVGYMFICLLDAVIRLAGRIRGPVSTGPHFLGS